MRLIDADEMLRVAERDFHRVCGNKEGQFIKAVMFNFRKSFIEMINLTPTAYDIGRVIERLKDEKNHCSIGCYEDYDDYDDYEQGKYDAYCHAIKIVKEGRMDEQIHRCGETENQIRERNAEG